MKEKELDVVIRIPERTFKRIQALARDGYFEHDLCGNSMRRIANGIPLPKGHGDLVDIKTLIDMFWDGNSMEIANSDLPAIKPLIEADAPKRREGIPLEENDSGYNCENWIP